mmetsp:Transcript_4048/g.8605  ORF Transcript_4048/g.8605 Transcript_4048/m.8605 type:complete len:549 (-) Transcript_4048:82-1728(-)
MQQPGDPHSAAGNGPVCWVCRRLFPTEEDLKRHELESAMHAENVVRQRKMEVAAVFEAPEPQPKVGEKRKKEDEDEEEPPAKVPEREVTTQSPQQHHHVIEDPDLEGDPVELQSSPVPSPAPVRAPATQAPSRSSQPALVARPDRVGVVRWYNKRRRMGFIMDPKRNWEDVFVTQLPSGLPSWPGAPCLFSCAEVDGKSVAINIRFTNKYHDIFSAAASLEGRKQVNEDRFVQLGLGSLGNVYCVFDGHSGTSCADFLTKNLHRHLMTSWRQAWPVQHGHLTVQDEVKLVTGALTEAFAVADKLYIQGASKKGSSDGSTAIMALVSDGFESEGEETFPGVKGGVTKVFCANVGDCRGILIRRTDTGWIPVRLSEDHKPTRKDEQQRVIAAGGHIGVDRGGCWRVVKPRGALHDLKKSLKDDQLRKALSVTRSFGDLELKSPPIISSVPEIKVVTLTSDDCLMVLASDGVWDVLSDAEVCAITIHPDHKSEESRAATICRAALEKGSGDNITAVVVRFGWGQWQRSSRAAAASGQSVSKGQDNEMDMFA